MNPDGTNQRAYYGSNSYFPTSYFDARPIPGRPSAMVGIVTGHHSTPRSGRLMIIDVNKGRREADGVVAEIPYSGRKVLPEVRDRQADGCWPRFLAVKRYLFSCRYESVSRIALGTLSGG